MSALGNAPDSGLPAERQHVHHSYIWLGGARAFFIVLVAVVASSASSLVNLAIQLSESGASLFASALMVPLMVAGVLLVLLVIFGIIVGIRALSWKHLWYEASPAEFSVYSGIFNKKRVHVPYQRIQSVDQRATLIQRIFGVCSVSIDTAGGSNNKAIVVPYVTKQQAETLRRDLFARKARAENAPAVPPHPGNVAPASNQLDEATRASIAATAHIHLPTREEWVCAYPPVPEAPTSGNILDVGDEAWQQVGGVFAGQAVETGHVSFEYGLSNKELLLSGISGNSGFVAVVAVVFAGLCSLASAVFDLVPGSDDAFVDAATSLAAHQGIQMMVVWTAGAIIAVSLVGWALSIVSTCLSYGGFRARRRDDRIEVERGLLQHTFQGVSVARVQSVQMKQGFIRRLMGYCELSLGRVDAGSDSDDGRAAKSTQQGVVIHPFLKRERVPEILAGLLPEFADLPAESERVKLAPAALRRGIIRRSIWQGGGFWLAVIACLLYQGFYLLIGIDSEFAADMATVVGIVDLAWLVLLALAVLLFVLDVVGAVLWFRESSFATNRRFMSITNGGFSIDTLSFPRAKIQFGFTSTNPFQRLANTATINARTAAGVGGTTARLIDVSADSAATYLIWLEPPSKLVST